LNEQLNRFQARVREKLREMMATHEDEHLHESSKRGLILKQVFIKYKSFVNPLLTKMEKEEFANKAESLNTRLALSDILAV